MEDCFPIAITSHSLVDVVQKLLSIHEICKIQLFKLSLNWLVWGFDLLGMNIAPVSENIEMTSVTLKQLEHLRSEKPAAAP